MNNKKSTMFSKLQFRRIALSTVIFVSMSLFAIQLELFLCHDTKIYFALYWLFVFLGQLCHRRWNIGNMPAYDEHFNGLPQPYKERYSLSNRVR